MFKSHRTRFAYYYYAKFDDNSNKDTSMVVYVLEE